MPDLHTISQGLLEYETLSGDEIINLLKGIQPTREDTDDSSDDKGAAVPTAGAKKTKKKKPKSDGGMEPQPQT